MSMAAGILLEKSLDALIARLREAGPVYAPAADGDGATFKPVSSASETSLGSANTRLSVKGVFFPQRETLLRFRSSILESAPLPDGPFSVIGVRPCDARSLSFLDRVFGSSEGRTGNAPFEDPYFLARRRVGLVIALACDSPEPGCFCASVGGSPYGTEGADVLMSGASEGAGGAGAYLLEAATEKGDVFLRILGGLIAPAADADIRARERRAEKAAASQPRMDFSSMKARLDQAFDSPAWTRISEACLGCGACTYLCPTCHCFDITDESEGESTTRVRGWDSCQYALFTAHASGHNPRPGKRERMRQRLMHKFSMAVVTAGTVLCSGCGRCMRYCPVGLDIREMLETAAGGSP
jgi:sulfhydrogenase subunit beta (sulfur reductase)